MKLKLTAMFSGIFIAFSEYDLINALQKKNKMARINKSYDSDLRMF